MGNVRVIGTFGKHQNHIFREKAYIQWGNNPTSIGSFLLLNPGKAGRNKLNDLTTGEHSTLEIEPDPTMEQMIKLIEGIYGKNPSGRVNLYNLFPLQNTHQTNAIQDFELLCSTGKINIVDLIPPVSELQNNPWICLSWGVVTDKKYHYFNELRTLWMEQIRQSDILFFGKKHKSKGLSYYHICPQLQTKRSSMVKDLLDIFKKDIETRYPTKPSVIFTSSATKPNIYHKTETHDQDEASEEISSEFEWAISRRNPEDIVNGFSQLRIKESYKLRGYEYIEGGNGNGIVWAIPSDKELPPVQECEYLDDRLNAPPKPSIALGNFMEAIDGDQTPFSYLQAAICYHELGDFAARGYGLSWRYNRILPIEAFDYQKYDSVKEYLESIGNWKQLTEIPKELNPQIYYIKGCPTIVFYSINHRGETTLKRYTHTFNCGGYVQEVAIKIIGYGYED